MKKYAIIMVLCLILCGCGSKKEAKKEVIKDSISVIGVKDVTYKLRVNCGERTAESALFLGKDNSFYFNLYECSGSNLHLTNAKGSYKVNKDKIILTDNYEKKWDLVVNNDQVEIKLNGIAYILTN